MSACPGCGHAPHAGRCHKRVWLFAAPKARLTQCSCKHKREISNDTDRRDDRGDPAGPALPIRLAAGADAELVGAEPRRVSLAAQIEGIEMVAARMRGEG